MRFLEQGFGGDRIPADADYFHALIGQWLQIITEAARLLRSAAGQSRGKEVDDNDLFAEVIARFPRLVLVVSRFKRWRCIASLERFGP